MAMAFGSDVNWSDPYTREQTFTTWPHTDPSPHAVSRAGFFVKASPDTVECYACGVTLSNWKPGEHPQRRHKDAAPDCPLVENIIGTEQAGSVSTEDTGLGSSIPSATATEHFTIEAPRTGSSIETTINIRHAVPPPRRRRPPSPPPPRYKQPEPRLASFEGVYWPPELEATVDKMAKAGFYYIGPYDRVKCGYCGGKLKNWRPTDSAIEEHVKHFPDCSFVKTIEKQTVVLSKNIRTKDKRESCHSHKDVMLMKEPDRLKTARISPGKLIEKALLRMGHPKADIRAAKKKVKGNEALTYNVQTVLREVQEMHRNAPTGSVPAATTASETTTTTATASSATTTATASSATTTATASSATTTATASAAAAAAAAVDSESEDEGLSSDCDDIDSLIDSSQSVDEQVKQLEIQLRDVNREKEELTNQITCKICLTNRVDTLFLTCRHLVTCKSCGDRVKDCPICRTVILGTVDVYMPKK